MCMVNMMTYYFSVRGFGHPVFLKPHFGHPVMKILAKNLHPHDCHIPPWTFRFSTFQPFIVGERKPVLRNL